MSYFATAEYAYLSSTNEAGDIVFPLQVTEEGKPMKDVVRVELLATIRAFERMGIVICVLGLALNLPWIIGLDFFANNLTFSA